jgi:hypothetical protein
VADKIPGSAKEVLIRHHRDDRGQTDGDAGVLPRGDHRGPSTEDRRLSVVRARDACAPLELY